MTALEMVVDDLARANTSVESSGAPDAQDPSEFFNATFAPDLTPGSAQSGEVQEATELGAQYAAAMKGFRGGERGSLEELLRRTGPQWKHMSEGTALQVLEAMEQLVKVPPPLPPHLRDLSLSNHMTTSNVGVTNDSCRIQNTPSSGGTNSIQYGAVIYSTICIKQLSPSLHTRTRTHPLL